MTFDEHVEKLGKLALTIFPDYDTFKIRETDKYFFMSVKRNDPVKQITHYKQKREQYEISEVFKEYEESSRETVIAIGQSLSELEENIELLKKEKSK